jgi:DNA-binding XRE family transcriptional regulator
MEKGKTAKWGKDYYSIISVALEGNGLMVVFANGDHCVVQTSALLPAGVSDPQWKEAQVATDGPYIIIPASPCQLEIPWDVIRVLTDVEFAKHMAEAAARQARYYGTVLRKLRHERGMTQAQVAERAQIEPANLSRIENGKFDVATSTLLKVLTAMGYNFSDLSRFPYKPETD